MSDADKCQHSRVLWCSLTEAEHRRPLSGMRVTDHDFVREAVPAASRGSMEKAVVEAALAELQIAVSRPVGVAMNLEETERAQRAYLALDRALNA